MDKYIISYLKDGQFVKEVLEDSLENILKKYANDTFRLDKIIEIKKVNYYALSSYIQNNETLMFPYGMIIDNNYILCEEIATNYIVDYKNRDINFEKLNNYLFKINKNSKRVDSILDCDLFQTESYYYDGKELKELYFCNGFHMQKRTSKEAISDIIDNSINRLYSMLLPAGKFIYGFSSSSGESLGGYNIVRHCGALWSLCLCHEVIHDVKAKERLEASFDYIINNFMIFRGDKAFILNYSKSEYALGANALGLLAFCEYYNRFSDERYLDYTNKLANGLLSCQQPDGCFYHGYTADLKLKDKNITVYYDGETTFALLKYYGISKDKRYYQAVLNAFDYFIENNYEKFIDHWIAHSLRELMVFNQDDKYVTFLVDNFYVGNRHRFSPVRLEALISLYEGYCIVKAKKKASQLLTNFPLEETIKGIASNVEMLTGYYVGEEVDIFLDHTYNPLYGYFCPSDNFRFRIDDIQHAASGFYYYMHSDLDR